MIRTYISHALHGHLELDYHSPKPLCEMKTETSRALSKDECNENRKLNNQHSLFFEYKRPQTRPSLDKACREDVLGRRY